MKPKLMYTDKAGNRLYVRYIKTRGAYQWSGKNAEGQIINKSAIRTLMQRALRDRAAAWERQGDHETAEHLRKLVKELPKTPRKPTKSGKWGIQRVKLSRTR
jgi:hypothetical protein